MEQFNQILGAIDEWLYLYGLVAMLIGVGFFCTLVTGGVQITHLRDMWQSIVSSRTVDEEPLPGTAEADHAPAAISSFQAFAVGLASRVGIGNVAGVALALVAGGPGAMFWMWVVAILGMATSFVESTLAQIFKERAADGTYRGGPAYYMRYGLGAKKLGSLFALLLLFSVGICVVMVQSNAAAGIMAASHSVPTWVTGLILAGMTLPVVLGGLRSVARVTEMVAPAMALVYVVVTIGIMLYNIDRIPGVFSAIIASAFGTNEALAGIAGGAVAAILNGARRGLFSNEAGLGTVPNAAGTATVSHPVRQGFIQSFGVFVDTIVVCSATGFLILLTTNTYQPGVDLSAQGAVLTHQALAEHLGNWVIWPMEVLLLVLVFSTILGCYSYGQVNVDYLGGNRNGQRIFGLVLTAAVFVGAVTALSTVWALADIALGVGAVLNMVVMIILSPWVTGALRDFSYQKAAGREPVFVGHNNDFLPGNTPGGVWESVIDVEGHYPKR
ncbi:alanine/glycine:cation symporter family protein [Actinomyces vulturis]|uniref:alanine/glycine:cation symporter family protein n=1 Tax=Actinomyces vulturis TaxID=1857645 RepID=UPI000833B4F4|nr:alanine/glycine:cation symporter family protein [Actinomyces vulturis]